jgi:hypothetical protein
VPDEPPPTTAASDDPGQLRHRIALLDEIEQQIECGDATPLLLTLRDDLERANARVYSEIRERIRRGDGRAALSTWLDIAAQPDAAVFARDGYDHLDAIIAEIIQLEEPGPAGVEPTSEMVFYQPTPARHILDLLRRTALTARDVLVDLGAGMGHVAILAAIYTDARITGIELEPSYVACARRAAEGLNLHAATFVEDDARNASLDDGTVFFLYTPFSGGILRTVLDALHEQATRRRIRVCTFGPCTTAVAAEPWLGPEEPIQPGRVAIFQSAEPAR